MKFSLKRLINSNHSDMFGMLVCLVLLVIVFSALSPAFLTFSNISNLVLASALVGIVAAGMTVVIISGGFDLSVGGNVALTGVVAASLLADGRPQWIAALVGLCVGLGVGLFNGISITKFRINPFITTLAMMIIVRAVAFIYTDGVSFAIRDTSPVFPDFGFWGRGILLGVPVPVWMFILVSIGVYILLNKTIIGREIYAIGGNEEAAKVSGININKVKLIVYLIVGVLASFSGILLASRLTAGIPGSGNGYEFQAITAVILGGASLSGGRGKIQNTILAIIVLGVLGNGFILIGLSSFHQDFARGVLLLISVGIDQLRQRRGLK